MTTMAVGDAVHLHGENRQEMSTITSSGANPAASGDVRDARDGIVKAIAGDKQGTVCNETGMHGGRGHVKEACLPEITVNTAGCERDSSSCNRTHLTDHCNCIGARKCTAVVEKCMGVSDICMGASENCTDFITVSEKVKNSYVVSGNPSIIVDDITVQGEADGEGEENTSENLDYVPGVVPPDGGWGWVVVFASFMSNVIVDGIIFSNGMFLGEYINAFGEGKSKTALIGSLLSGFYLIVGPFVSALANKFGFRTVSVVGSFVSCFGMILSFFATSVDFLCFSFGVMGGVGFGLIYMPAVIAVGFYFEKKRALATGISVCGSGIGTFIMAPVITKLIQGFGWRGAMLILGSISLNCTVFGCLFRPITAVVPSQEEEECDSTGQRTPLLVRIKRARDEMTKWDSSYSVDSYDRAHSILLVDKGIVGNGVIKGSNANADIHGMCNTRPRVSSFTSTRSREGSVSSRPTLSTFTGRKPRASSSSNVRNRECSISNIIQKDITVTAPGITPDLKLMRTDNCQSGCVNSLETNDKKLKRRSVPCVLTTVGSKLTTEEVIHTARSAETFDSVAARLEDIKEKSEENSNSAESNALLQMERNVKAGAREVDKNKNTPSCENKNEQRKNRRRACTRYEGMRPFYRDDIFFSGSLMRLSQYAASKGDLDRYHRSVSHIPTAAQLKQEEQQCHLCPLAFRATLANMLDFSLLKSPTFLLLCVSGSVTMIGLFVPFMFLADRAILSGIDTEAATFLISVIGILNTAGRVVCGWISDHPRINALFINNFALTFGGIGTILSPHFDSYTMLVVYACVFGVSLACFASLRSILVVELLGLEKLTNAFGLLLLFQGLAATIGAPIAGAFFDATQSYDASFYLAGSFILASGIMCYPINVLNRWERKRNARKEEENMTMKV